MTPCTEATGPVEDCGAQLDIRRLRWRCRRGMKELDVLLERFVQRGLAQAGDEERQVLAELLALGDPELADYLLAGLTPADPRLAQLVGHIRTLCRLQAPG